jgi:hypothetical protein
MELVPRQCPVCHSADITYHSPSTTKNHGSRVLDTCATGPASCSATNNTLLEGLQTPGSVIGQVVKARPAGMGCKAAARTLEKAKKTILAWARKLLDLPRGLLL